MNAKLLACIAMGVFVAHMAIFMLVQRVRTWNDPIPAPPPRPNFRSAQEEVVDPKTGEKMVHREITVSTQLRPELYQERPQPPAAKQGE